jgi:hypothetical protein
MSPSIVRAVVKAEIKEVGLLVFFVCILRFVLRSLAKSNQIPSHLLPLSLILVYIWRALTASR